jgi:hypothetical protein
MVPYAIWIDRAARKRGIQNRLVPLAPATATPPASTAQGIVDTTSG